MKASGTDKLLLVSLELANIGRLVDGLATFKPVEHEFSALDHIFRGGHGQGPVGERCLFDLVSLKTPSYHCLTSTSRRLATAFLHLKYTIPCSSIPHILSGHSYFHASFTFTDAVSSPNARPQLRVPLRTFLFSAGEGYVPTGSSFLYM